MSTQAPQMAVNPLTMASLVITAVGKMIVTAAVKSDKVFDNVGDVAVYGTSALARVAKGVDARSEIYANAIVINGELAEREHTVKHRIRLRALEEQEAAHGTPPVIKPTSKPAKKTAKKVEPSVVS